MPTPIRTMLAYASRERMNPIFLPKENLSDFLTGLIDACP